ncbi:RNA polymerase sigma factor [Aquimarina sediminis]|uniref:RNA polymerase sigma factor n=1 Tax=Aquimarina sediminis TaxID=2070536 RepID=UPI000CA0516C|nr:sigma-70 family RNA polymerase sigma factor [Aquimarina sediminis]
MPEKLHKNVCDDNIFSVIYREYSHDLLKYLYYKFGESCDPRDKVQDAFVKLLDKCKEVPPDSAKGFLFKVASNMMLNEIKHQKVVLKYKKIKPKEYTNESPEFVLEEKEFLKKYQKALSLLTEDQRVAFLLNKVEGKKQAEIAEMLGTTRKAIENRVYMAYNNLKKSIGELK